MATLVTGSSGHLGDALVRTLAADGEDVAGLDVRPASGTTHVASLVDRAAVRSAMRGVDVVFHTATLHKPHVATHTKRAFVDTNITGTLVLLEEAVRARVSAFVFTSTTSTFGDALRPGPEEPAAWITESVQPRVKNIYGTTKLAAEDLCQLFHRNEALPCIVLRTSRFFPEQDDDRGRREGFEDANLKLNEFLYRRVDIEDVVSAHRCAARAAANIGFGKYIVSATTPFSRDHCAELRADPSKVVARVVPGYASAFADLGWRMLDDVDRIYVNAAARDDLRWRPRHDFETVLRRVVAGGDVLSALARAVGAKGYHDETFTDGPYPVA